MKKVLIVKTGYSETFNSSLPTDSVSLGDIIRTTPILHCLSGEVTWITSNKIYPLLDNISKINTLLYIENIELESLGQKVYDLVLYLESDKNLITFLQYKKIIFASDVIYSSWSKSLFQLIDNKWNGQPYIINREIIKQGEKIDIGLNYLVGKKQPSKAVPIGEWQKLKQLLTINNFSVSWQKGERNLVDYVNWISSAKLLITTDSLGLHLAFALKKKVVCIFKTTQASDVHLYYGSKALLYCEHLDYKQVISSVKDLLNDHNLI